MRRFATWMFVSLTSLGIGGIYAQTSPSTQTSKVVPLQTIERLTDNAFKIVFLQDTQPGGADVSRVKSIAMLIWSSEHDGKIPSKTSVHVPVGTLSPTIVITLHNP